MNSSVLNAPVTTDSGRGLPLRGKLCVQKHRRIEVLCFFFPLILSLFFLPLFLLFSSLLFYPFAFFLSVYFFSLLLFKFSFGDAFSNDAIDKFLQANKSEKESLDFFHGIG
jgi:hypothetical protein